MANDPKAENVTERNQNLALPELKSAATIITEISGAIGSLSKTYDRIGLAGTFTVSSVVLAIVTIVFSYFSGTQIGDKWQPGVNLHEEILFGCIAITFAGLGTVFQIQNSSKESQRELLAMEIERERNKFNHELTMAKLRV